MDWRTPTGFAIIIAILGTGILSFMLIVIWQVKKYVTTVQQETAKRHILEVQHQQQLAAATIESMEAERKRIAADIHDGLIGSLRFMMLNNDDPEFTASLQNTITTARNISHDLMPPLIDRLPLEELLTLFLAPLKQTHAVEVNITNDSTTIATNKKLHLYRIVQELVNNTIVHAQASSIGIHIRNSTKRFALIYTDNGCGLSDQGQEGLGMKNIAMRCTIIEAQHKFKSHSPHGLKMILTTTL
ncbi:MAG: hypothetical protein MI974_10945 [Chitinophagales bacterium]|nr:hypothetical protein [Chitinophagales bacterium]